MNIHFKKIMIWLLPSFFLLSCQEVTTENTTEEDVTVSTTETTFDPSPAWPLCGQITKDTTAAWQPGDNCPADRIGSAQYSDFPLSSTLGPRLLVSENKRYDFHRGIDIPAALNTPVFAIADGTVYKAGQTTGYNEPMIMLRHFRTGYTGDGCTESEGCYHSVYLHLSQDKEVLVQVSDKVKKGDLIGYTGASASGFAHLHFELRKAPKDDAYSSWQRDIMHPLTVLPYVKKTVNNMQVAISHVNQTGTQLQVTATVSVPMDELDLARIEAEIYQKSADGSLHPITQPGNTVNSKGYPVNPAWFDIVNWNREYTHKNSSKVTWASFNAGGDRECPYHEKHSDSYDANIHLDQADPNDYKTANFNGILISPNHYNATSTEYFTQYVFNHLVSADDMNDTCVKIVATNVQNTTQVASHNCD